MNSARRTPVLLLLSAPSGAGKTTLCQNLLAQDPQLTRAVTCTTRPPRPGEVPDRDYHFLEPAVFQERLGRGEFLESAQVYGYAYGTWRVEVLDRLRQGQDVLLNIDVQGAAQVRAGARDHADLHTALCSVFVVPPSLADLEARLVGRGQDAAEVMQRRLAAAQGEIRRWAEFDYVVVNDDLPCAVRQLQAILEAERARSGRLIPWFL